MPVSGATFYVPLHDVVKPKEVFPTDRSKIQTLVFLSQIERRVKTCIFFCIQPVKCAYLVANSASDSLWIFCAEIEMTETSTVVLVLKVDNMPGKRQNVLDICPQHGGGG